MKYPCHVLIKKIVDNKEIFEKLKTKKYIQKSLIYLI